jgi:hypothetical protein
MAWLKSASAKKRIIRQVRSRRHLSPHALKLLLNIRRVGVGCAVGIFRPPARCHRLLDFFLVALVEGDRAVDLRQSASGNATESSRDPHRCDIPK